MASTPVTTASGPGLTWTAPAHWKAKPGSAMRKGSYAIAGDGGEADLAITAFPGDVGGDLAAISRTSIAGADNSAFRRSARPSWRRRGRRWNETS